MVVGIVATICYNYVKYYVYHMIYYITHACIGRAYIYKTNNVFRGIQLILVYIIKPLLLICINDKHMLCTNRRHHNHAMYTQAFALGGGCFLDGCIYMITISPQKI